MLAGECVVYIAANEAEAAIITGLLTSAGIRCYVFDRSSTMTGAPGHGYDVVVREEDAADARVLLEPEDAARSDGDP